MRFTTDENEDCRDIAVRVREIGECQPIYEDDTYDEFWSVLRLIYEAWREMPPDVKKKLDLRYREAHRDELRAYNRQYRLSHIEQERERQRKYRMKKKGEI